MEQVKLQDKDILFLYKNLVEKQKKDFLASLPVKKKMNKGNEEYVIGNITVVYIPETKKFPPLIEENHIYILFKKKEYRVQSLMGHLRNAFCHNYFIGEDDKFIIKDFKVFDDNNKKYKNPKKNMIGKVDIEDLKNLISVLKK